MKNISLLLLLSVCAIISFAQPTISSTQFLFNNTDTVTVVTVAPPNFSPGPSGANVNWDFSNLTPSSLTNTIQTGECPGVAFCSSFPTANIYQRTLINGQTGYNYLAGLKSSNEYKILGGTNHSGIPSFFKCTNEKIEYKFPISYNQTFSDPYSCLVIFGKQTVTVDGYGTLQTPTATYSDVLRVKKVSQDTIVMTGQSTYVYQTTTYSWIKADMPELLVIMQRNQTLPVPSYSTYITYSHTTTAVNSILENSILENSITIYPNPANNSINLKVNNLSISKIEMLNIWGKSLLKRDFDTKEYNLDISKFPNGIYTLHVFTNKGRVLKKVVVTK